jgi:hypothetical protein
MAFDDDQPRDEMGRWTSGGGGGGGPAVGEGQLSGLDAAGGFPTEQGLVEQVAAEAAAKDVWAQTSTGGLGQEFTNEEGRAYLEENSGTVEPVEGHEGEQAQYLTEREQKLSISGYQDGQYHEVNDSLRADSVRDDLQTDVANIDSAIAQQAPTTEDTILYRGYSQVMPTTPGVSTPPDYTAMEPGETFTDKGFVSSSIDKSVSEQFSRRGGTENPNTGGMEKSIMAVHVPEGSQGLNVNGLMPGSGEDEIILPRGSEFQVLGREGLVTHVALLPRS